MTGRPQDGDFLGWLLDIPDPVEESAPTNVVKLPTGALFEPGAAVGDIAVDIVEPIAEQEVAEPPVSRPPMQQLIDSLDRPPPYQIGDVPWHCMATLIGDARRLHQRHEEELRALGWTIEDLYGCDLRAPFVRLDKQGLAWCMCDHRVIELTAEYVRLETFSGASQRFFRPSAKAGHAPR